MNEIDALDRILQLAQAMLSAYYFTRKRSKGKERLFFVYTLLMLLPFQVTIVPNFIVAKLLNGKSLSSVW
ncbi:MAG: hypothetical protein E7294_11450 [Lachnospiraceae bacterium]|nr:hypothetical protein [Lachnospiraceae bacterium]